MLYYGLIVLLFSRNALSKLLAYYTDYTDCTLKCTADVSVPQLRHSTPATAAAAAVAESIDASSISSSLVLSLQQIVQRSELAATEGDAPSARTAQTSSTYISSPITAPRPLRLGPSDKSSRPATANDIQVCAYTSYIILIVVSL
jgi:hypothetical protein